jgi:hypothetical protein
MGWNFLALTSICQHKKLHVTQNEPSNFKVHECVLNLKIDTNLKILVKD